MRSSYVCYARLYGLDVVLIIFMKLSAWLANFAKQSRASIALWILLLLPAVNAHATKFKPIEIDLDYQHDRFNTQPKDLALNFHAYFSSFDTEDDDNLDGKEDIWRLPHFVSYEMRAIRRNLAPAPGRPNPWIQVDSYIERGIYPTDASYAYSNAFRRNNPDWYIRGHLCAKYHAWRLGKNADWNTHTFFNAIPQRSQFNSGIWENLERLTDQWANKHGKIWVIVGPIFDDGSPSEFIGETDKNEPLVAIPSALFKIVIRMTQDDTLPVDVMAFIYPQEDEAYSRLPYNHKNFLATINEIEESTGLDFLTILPNDQEEQVESILPDAIWQ